MESDKTGSATPVKIFPARKKAKKPARRGATWTEDEIHNLFRIWKQPDILGLLGEKKGSGTNTLAKVVGELGKQGFTRTVEEVRAKVKNLKGEYRRAKENGNSQGFKYFTNVDNILDPYSSNSTTSPLYSSGSSGNLFQQISTSNASNTIAHFKVTDQATCSSMDQNVTVLSSAFDQDQMVHLHQNEHPVQIEFELMSNLNVDFEPMKGAELPIEIDDESLVLPSEFGTEEEPEEIVSNALNLDNLVVDGFSDVSKHQGDNTPLIVITTTTDLQESEKIPNTMEYSFATTSKKRNAEESSAPEAETRQGINQKRRKLQSISDKMAETVSKLLTSSAEQVIAEMKAAEENFMKSEEKRRAAEQKREELMFQQLIQALKTPQSPKVTTTLENNASSESARSPVDGTAATKPTNLSGSNVIDPFAAGFDALGNRLVAMIQEQFKECEENLEDWEQKMERQESRHTQKLFNFLINSATSKTD